MSAIIILTISITVIAAYNGLKKSNKGYAKMIDSVTPWWNISINL